MRPAEDRKGVFENRKPAGKEFPLADVGKLVDQCADALLQLCDSLRLVFHHSLTCSRKQRAENHYLSSTLYAASAN